MLESLICHFRPSLQVNCEPRAFDSIYIFPCTTANITIPGRIISRSVSPLLTTSPPTMAPSGPLKRKQAPQFSKREAKRVKISSARTILAQASDKALSNNGDLDVSAFIKAREFEIKAMAASMGASKNSLSTRAFQQVPRDLRRRTASHNVKRVPKRLRARAAREVRRAHRSIFNEHERLIQYRKWKDEGR